MSLDEESVHELSGPQDWWNKKFPKAAADKWKDGVTYYIIHHSLKIEHAVFDNNFFKGAVGFAGVGDINWDKFNMEEFEPTKYKAHKQMEEALKDEFDRQVKADEDKKKAN